MKKIIVSALMIAAVSAGAQEKNAITIGGGASGGASLGLHRDGVSVVAKPKAHDAKKSKKKNKASLSARARLQFTFWNSFAAQDGFKSGINGDGKALGGAGAFYGTPDRRPAANPSFSGGGGGAAASHPSAPTGTSDLTSVSGMPPEASLSQDRAITPTVPTVPTVPAAPTVPAVPTAPSVPTAAATTATGSVWPNCPPQFSPTSKGPDGTPCPTAPPARTFKEMWPSWQAYCSAKSIIPYNNDWSPRAGSSNCEQPMPAGHWLCWTPDEIARFGFCLSNDSPFTYAQEQLVDGYFNNLAGGMSSEAYLNNQAAIQMQLCSSYCAAEPGRAGCGNYPQTQAPVVVFLGSDGTPSRSFGFSEPITMIVSIPETTGAPQGENISACATLQGGTGCVGAAFRNLASHGFTCTWPGQNRYACRRTQATSAQGLIDGKTSVSADVYFRDDQSGAITKTTYTIHPD